MVGLTLFLSSKLKNPMTVLVIDIAIIMLPVFLSIKSAFGILNKILFLMPYNAIYSNFSQMVSYKLGNIVIDLPMMTIITYIFMMVITLICAKKTYSKLSLSYYFSVLYIFNNFIFPHFINYFCIDSISYPYFR